MSSLRTAILESGEEIAVETNQRALIDKVLARYSGAFTVYRELLQNSDDAGASTVEIRFKSTPELQPVLQQGSSLPPLAEVPTSRVEFKNDGAPFNQDDWARLRKIAEGNPDEQKIGAFGVGFYSLFSLTEEPLVSSGDSAMVFLWKKDQLYVRQGSNTNADKDRTDQGRPWTTFDITLRQAEPMPQPEDFCRFLADALIFTVRLRSLRVYMDDHCLCDLNKKTAPPQSLRAASNINLRSMPLKMLTVKSVDVAHVQIDARVMKWVTQPETQKARQAAAEADAYSKRTLLGGGLGGASKFLQSAFGFGSSSSSKSSGKTEASSSSAAITAAAEPPPDLLECTKSTVFLRTVNGNIAVSCPRQLSNELERATKKKPPSQTVFSMLFNSHDELEASAGGEDRHAPPPEAHRLFAKLLTNLSRQGSVAIGFMTHQTTGFSSSIGARFIPTVERESLDLMNSYTADWNKELLWVGGVLSRIVYEDQMSEIKRLWAPQLAPELQQKLLARFVHLAQFFTFSASTPSNMVSSIFEQAFFDSAPSKELSLLSSEGPMPVHRVRQPDHMLQAFLKSTPVLPAALAEQAPDFIMALQRRRLLREIEMLDILTELRSRALEPEELQAALKWWILLAASAGYNTTLRDQFLDAAMVRTESPEQGERVTSLSSVKYYLGSRTLLTKVPPPPESLPVAVSKAFKQTDLQRIFSWQEMPMTAELAYLSSPALAASSAPDQTNLLKTPAFAEEVLTTISRNWNNTSVAIQEGVVKLLKDLACIPSTKGMKLPTESYFDNINSLQLDLAVVQLPSRSAVRGNMEKLLLGAGVRKHVELQLIFTQLVAGGSWSHVDLIKYLLSIQESLSKDELGRLAKTAWLPKEGEDAAEGAAKPPKYKASQLYEPTQTFRSLKLPLLSWTGRFGDPESKFLQNLGLQKYPAITPLLEAAADPKDATRRKEALRYYLDHYLLRYHSAPTPDHLAYVPSINSDGVAGLSKPSEVFANSLCSVLGFSTLPSGHSADAGKFRVEQDPPATVLLAALIARPPQDRGKATAVFSYLATRIVTFENAQLLQLSKSPIIPVTDKTTGVTHMRMPSTCYFSTSGSPAIAAVFTSIDFGLPSKPFLAACGVRDSPSTPEIAEMLISDASGILKLAGSSEAYLDVLRPIAAARSTLPPAVTKRLRASPFFLTTTRVPAEPKSKSEQAAVDEVEDEEEDNSKILTQLKPPNQTVIVDDVNIGRLFGAHVFAAPEEDALELFAESLGAMRVTRIVKDKHLISGPLQADTPAAQELRALLLERTSLFLHERQGTSEKEVIRGSDWLKKRLRVQEVRKLDISRSLSFAGRQHTVTMPASATAELTSNNDLLLYFTSSGIDDWFEVAVALCRFILSKQRVNDALLLMTLLSTPLKVLQRRGFDTSRILNSRKAERRKQMEQQRDAGLQAELAKPAQPSESDVDSWAQKLSAEFPEANRELVKRLLQAQTTDHYSNVYAQLVKGYRKSTAPTDTSRQSGGTLPPSTLTPQPPRPSEPAQPDVSEPSPPAEPSRPNSGFFSGFRRKMLGSSASKPSEQEPSSSLMRRGSSTRTSEPSRPSSASTTQPSEQPTPYTNIENSVKHAIMASRPNSSNHIQDLGRDGYVRESEAAFCDSRPAVDLVFVSNTSGLRFYASKGVEVERLLMEHLGALERLADYVVKPLAGVFAMRSEAFHLFYDLKGPTIAFNRGGAIWINLRYYLAWHDAQVKKGDYEPALLSNYFSISHELAHNIVQEHNAQHGFYTCSIAEFHFTKLAEILEGLRKRGTAGAQPLVQL